MIYFEDFRVTRNAIEELVKRSVTASKRSMRVAQELSTPSRGMQMVPKYLEVALYKGKERFNNAEVTEITNLIQMFGSEIPADDLVKQLLNIGIEKGEPLSAGEMRDFLQATPFLDGKGQMKVIQFMKALKEQDTFKYDAKYVAENSSFEKFMGEVVNKHPDIYQGMTEERLKECYNDRLRKEINMCQYKAYTSQFDVEPQNISQYINLKNPGFIYGIAQCDKPEILAVIVQKTGITQDMPELTNELVSAYELSDGNVKLVQDLIRVFYPMEIKQIVSKLDMVKKTHDLSKYENRTFVLTDHLSANNRLPVQRKDVLEALNLTGEIDLLPLKQYASVITVSGNFERGKRQ